MPDFPARWRKSGPVPRLGTIHQPRDSKVSVPGPYAIYRTLLLVSCCFEGGCQSSAIHVSSILNCSQLIHYLHPTYPKEAERRRTQGTVRLRAVSSATGELRDIEVLQGDPILVPAALRAVKKWRYSVCRLNGTVVEPVIAIDVSFNLGQ